MTGAEDEIGLLNSAQVFQELSEKPGAQLVDVRSQAEWIFVGVPDLSPIGKQVLLVEWQSFPGWAINTRFESDLAQLMQNVSVSELFFLCRSGVRSMAAAQRVAMSQLCDGVKLNNVVDGFEGELNQEGKRGLVSGWKASDLPWRQK